ncbi:hypothetical protein [Streptomyces sp. NPDC001480]|uniref:hypothetical protein n=1 Tax=Streptomyces sp. NPDC001480 TaxID=3364577 RepID=UPI0036841E3A
MTDRLTVSQQLDVNDELISANGIWKLTLQSDGNLVLYRADRVPFWETRTYGKPVTRATFQADGNFVCYDRRNHPWWASGSNESGGAYIVIQDDGNLVIYDSSGSPKWASDTSGDKYRWHTDLHDPEGWTEVEITRNGSARFSGHVHNEGAFSEPEDFTLRTATSGSTCLLFQRSGHLGGFGDSSSRNDWWDESSSRPDVAANFDDLIGSLVLRAAESKKGVITGPLDDVIDFTVGVVEGSILAGVPGIEVVLFGGELASLVLTGSLIPGARIIAGTLYMTGLLGGFYALTGAGVARIGGKQRNITSDEYEWANDKVFGGSLPPKDAILITDTIGAGDNCFTFPAPYKKITVNIGPERYDNPRDSDPGIFIHELTHAWQIQHMDAPAAWITRGFAAQLFNVSYDYENYGRPFRDFNIEQQAQLVEEWYVGCERQQRLMHRDGFYKHQEGFPAEDNRGASKGGNPFYEYIVNNIWMGRI